MQPIETQPVAVGLKLDVLWVEPPAVVENPEGTNLGLDEGEEATVESLALMGIEVIWNTVETLSDAELVVVDAD